MTQDRTTRVDRVLPQLFVELADPRTPAYLEAAIERASSNPQRPAWTFPGRWLPVQISTSAAPAARGPWRQLGVLALIGILIAVAAVAYVGSRPSQPALPAPPFGPAANGVIALERDGDILVADRANGETRPLIAGPETDTAPVFSPDGTSVAFQRAVDGQSDLTALMLADADGSNVVQVTPEPLEDLHSWSFAPDGRSLAAIARLDDEMRVIVRPIDPAAAATVLDVALPSNAGDIESVSFRPTTEPELLVMAAMDPSGRRGIVVHELTTGETRTVAAPPADAELFGAVWSSTGENIIYSQFDPAADGISARTHVVAADGSGDRRLDEAPGTTFDLPASPASNDGTRVVLFRGPDGVSGEKALVVSISGDGAPVELACGPTTDVVCASRWIWSPDDSTLIGTVVGGGYLQADPSTGTVTPLDWDGTNQPNWQRVGP